MAEAAGAEGAQQQPRAAPQHAAPLRSAAACSMQHHAPHLLSLGDELLSHVISLLPSRAACRGACKLLLRLCDEAVVKMRCEDGEQLQHAALRARRWRNMKALSCQIDDLTGRAALGLAIHRAER